MLDLLKTQAENTDEKTRERLNRHIELADKRFSMFQYGIAYNPATSKFDVNLVSRHFFTKINDYYELASVPLIARKILMAENVQKELQAELHDVEVHMTLAYQFRQSILSFLGGDLS